MVLLGQALAEDGTGPGTGDVGGDPAADDPGGPEDAHAQDGERGGDGGAGAEVPAVEARCYHTVDDLPEHPRLADDAERVHHRAEHGDGERDRTEPDLAPHHDEAAAEYPYAGWLPGHGQPSCQPK